MQQDTLELSPVCVHWLSRTSMLTHACTLAHTHTLLQMTKMARHPLVGLL